MTKNFTGTTQTEYFPINRGHEFLIVANVNSGSGNIDATIGTEAGAAAALTTSLTGDDNDLVFTAKSLGLAGNSVTVEYVDPSASSQDLSVSVTAAAIVVNLATDAGDAAEVVMDSSNPDADVTITADVAGTGGNAYSVEFIDPSANDAELTVSTVDNLKFTVSLGTSSGGAINSSVDDVTAALNAYAPFAALMTAASSGAGVVDAIAEQDLTGGGANYSITTTADEIKAALNANSAFTAFFTVSDAAANDGSGVVTALAETNLSGGTNGVFVDAGLPTLTGGDSYIGTNGAIDLIKVDLSSGSSADIDVTVVDLGRP